MPEPDDEPDARPLIIELWYETGNDALLRAARQCMSCATALPQPPQKWGSQS
jgi:hypothetical protein